MTHRLMADPVNLEIFKSLFASVAEEMGVRLQRSAHSPNIKERCDFSCALFNAEGELVAQASHIPVHLGAMPLSVKACIRSLPLKPGDIAIVNDPYHGGTHLPDLTMVSPIFSERDGESHLLGYVATRAHHADIGGMSPGSMPLSQEIYQEGVIIPPVKLVSEGILNQDLWRLFLANVRTPQERAGDLQAQMAANRTGIMRMHELIVRYGREEISRNMVDLLEYSETLVRHRIKQLPDGIYSFRDWLDDDGIEEGKVELAVTVTIQGDCVIVDFTGSVPQRRGSINAVYAITLSAVTYVFRCLLGDDIPANGGAMVPIRVLAPEGSVVHARFPSAVAGGNVETSQRLVDVLLGAMAQACPERVPAASQGTMNNLAIGGWDPRRNRPYTYYETMAGGMGAGMKMHGATAIHSHMTNTLNTPVEALEYAYPLRVHHYGVRRGSGGLGQHRGGDGLCREIEFLHEAQVTILSDRRIYGPYGLNEGQPGQQGRNVLIRNHQQFQLNGKTELEVNAQDRLRIETPGGGGFGA